MANGVPYNIQVSQLFARIDSEFSAWFNRADGDRLWEQQQAYLSRKFVKYDLLDAGGLKTLWSWYDHISSIAPGSHWETQDWPLIVLLAIRIRQDRVQKGIYGKD